MAADWTLQTCCNTSQIVFCCCFGGYLIINALLWRFAFMKPLKLIAVFVHEMSHAIACWCTGGKVKEINVYDNEGGVTRFHGGIMTLIIPAGYLGCAFWGTVFIVLSADVIAATVAACVFIVGLVAALFFAPNTVMIFLNIGFALLTLGFVLLQWLVPVFKPTNPDYFPILSLVTLYYGVFIGSFGIYGALPTVATGCMGVMRRRKVGGGLPGGS